MGRKRSHRDETRTKIVSARLTHDTYELISEHAERLGLTRAGYVEHLIENRPLRIVRGQMDELTVPLINELKRIGNNLNQIAHARNAGADIDPSHFHTVLADIIRVICRNELTRKHYADAYTEVVGQDRDDDAPDPARRGMPAPIVPATRGGGMPGTRVPVHEHARRETAFNDNPSPPFHPDAEEGRRPWSTAPRHLSPVHRHDPSPSSAWSKFLRRMHLRAS